MGIESVLKIGGKALTQVAKKAYVKPMCEVKTLESIGLKMGQLTGDVVQIKNTKVSVPSRFGTPQMEQARQMNRIAVHRLKEGTVARTYPKANIQDLKRLTSETIEDSYSRVEWINPKDGKVYNLLKQGETKDGKVIIRILDEDGAFIKEAEFSPKKIMIYDTSGNNIDFGKYYEEMSHGETVKRFAQRANPFADIEFVNIDHLREKNTIFNRYQNLGDELNNLHKSILKGNKVDYISLSIGLDPKIIPPQGLLEKAGKSLQEYKATVDSFPTSQFIKYHPNVRILQAASNGGKDVISPDLMFKSVEGVGALDRNGKVAAFSASRSSILTQHYEQGVFTKNPTKYGLGYFDAHSTDIAIKPEFLERAQKYLGTTPKYVDKSLEIRMLNLKKVASEKYKTEYEKMKQLVITKEEEQKLQELLKSFKEETNPLRREASQKAYWKYSSELHQKVTKAMEGYENHEGLEYKKLLRYVEENGFLRRLNNNTYSTFDRLPYTTDFNTMTFAIDNEGQLILSSFSRVLPLQGTSFSTPIRTAKLALNDMMEGIL